jgi:DNA-binding response OmpR family regulator
MTSAQPKPIELNDEDLAYLLTVLRNSNQPLTTQQLIDALRGQGR